MKKIVLYKIIIGLLVIAAGFSCLLSVSTFTKFFQVKPFPIDKFILFILGIILVIACVVLLMHFAIKVINEENKK